MEEPEEPPDIGPLEPCGVCGRRFKFESLRRHEVVCEKQAKKKIKVFDSSKQRRLGTELQQYLPKNLGIPATSSLYKPASPPKRRPSNWKAQHMELVETIRAARAACDPVRGSADGYPTGSTTPRPKKIPIGNEVCPHCERNFNQKAFSRHVEWCKEKTLLNRNKDKNVASAAQERLAARTKYKAPSLKTKRAATREKYLPPTAPESTNTIVQQSKPAPVIEKPKSPPIRARKSNPSPSHPPAEQPKQAPQKANSRKQASVSTTNINDAHENQKPSPPKGLPKRNNSNLSDHGDQPKVNQRTVSRKGVVNTSSTNMSDNADEPVITRRSDLGKEHSKVGSKNYIPLTTPEKVEPYDPFVLAARQMAELYSPDATPALTSTASTPIRATQPLITPNIRNSSAPSVTKSKPLPPKKRMSTKTVTKKPSPPSSTSSNQINIDELPIITKNKSNSILDISNQLSAISYDEIPIVSKHTKTVSKDLIDTNEFTSVCKSINSSTLKLNIQNPCKPATPPILDASPNSAFDKYSSKTTVKHLDSNKNTHRNDKRSSVIDPPLNFKDNYSVPMSNRPGSTKLPAIEKTPTKSSNLSLCSIIGPQRDKYDNYIDPSLINKCDNLPINVDLLNNKEIVSSSDSLISDNLPDKFDSFKVDDYENDPLIKQAQDYLNEYNKDRSNHYTIDNKLNEIDCYSIQYDQNMSKLDPKSKPKSNYDTDSICDDFDFDEFISSFDDDESFPNLKQFLNNNVRSKESLKSEVVPIANKTNLNIVERPKVILKSFSVNSSSSNPSFFENASPGLSRSSSINIVEHHSMQKSSLRKPPMNMLSNQSSEQSLYMQDTKSVHEMNGNVNDRKEALLHEERRKYYGREGTEHSDEEIRPLSPEPYTLTRSAASKFSADSAYGSLNRTSPTNKVLPSANISLSSHKEHVKDKASGDNNDHRKQYQHERTHNEFNSISSSSSESLPPISKNQQRWDKVPTNRKDNMNNHYDQITTPKMSKFCHECGSKFSVEKAKFCMECGVKRLMY